MHNTVFTMVEKRVKIRLALRNTERNSISWMKKKNLFDVSFYLDFKFNTAVLLTKYYYIVSSTYYD